MTAGQDIQVGEVTKPGMARRQRLAAARVALRLFMVLYKTLLRLSGWVGPGKRSPGANGFDILVTGTFYSDNWLKTHLVPMALSGRCARLRMVASTPVPAMAKVEAIYPPPLLTRLAGGVLARLLTFCWVAVRTRPHVLVGFHLLLNGMCAALLARFIGARSVYICGGGPREVLGGGYQTENRLFNKLGRPDWLIERWLIDIVRHFDAVIVMGSGTVRFFESRGAHTAYHVVPGGFDGELFFPSRNPPDKDLILVGRLSEVKRVDLFLRAIRKVHDRGRAATACIVGDGPDRQKLELLSGELGLDKAVEFVGWRNDVEQWLRRSRVFVLTSDSEGVSQAMIQAMLCAVPVVVSDVGDLRDLVDDGKNGYLVPQRTPDEFADRFLAILSDEDRWRNFSSAAVSRAREYEIKNVCRTWDGIMDSFEAPRDVRPALPQRESAEQGRRPL